jgi:hypothetical protein
MIQTAGRGVRIVAFPGNIGVMYIGDAQYIQQAAAEEPEYSRLIG